MGKNENDEVLRLLEKLNRAHGGTVMAGHLPTTMRTRRLYAVRNDLKRINRRLYSIERRMDIRDR